MWAAFLKPIVGGLLILIICVPVRWLAMRYIPQGRIKNILTFRLERPELSGIRAFGWSIFIAVCIYGTLGLIIFFIYLSL